MNGAHRINGAARRFFVWLHRWVGLLMTIFLVVVGLTGSVLAFRVDIEKWVNPQLFAARPAANARPLDLATLVERVEAAEPRIRVGYFLKGDEQVAMVVAPRTDPATGKPWPIDFDRVFVDPWTGRVLGHRRDADLSQGKINLVPFLYELHQSLALGGIGAWVLGIVALAWTLDCFWAAYLTLPITLAAFLRRWAPSWRVKWPSSAYRVNLDLHRASGLWLWPLLFVFAWSSVMFNLGDVYEWTTSRLFDYQTPDQQFAALMLKSPRERPALDWHQGLATAERRMAEVAVQRHFRVLGTTGLGYLPEAGAYTLQVDTDRDLSRHSWEGTGIWIDGDTGALKQVWMGTGEHSGNTVTSWLRSLHFANVRDSTLFRAIVCVIGLVITMQGGTGVYLWLKKRRARQTLKTPRFLARRAKGPLLD